MSRLGLYLRDELHRRDLSPEEFGRRSGLGTSHVYQIIRGQKQNIRQATVQRIAAGLNMTAGELLLAVDDEVADDPIEQAIRQRTAEMREAVRGTPREFWSTIIRTTFDRAIDGARDMAHLLASAGTHNTADAGTTDGSSDQQDSDAPARRKPEIQSGNLVFEPSL